MLLSQEDLDKKKIEVVVKGVSVSASLLAKILRKVANDVKNPKPVHGKQTIKQLALQNAGLSKIDIADEGLQKFKKYARKYEVDFSAVRSNGEPKKTHIFFKGRDADAMTAAFKEFSNEILSKKKERPSVLQTIRSLQREIRGRSKNRERTLERGESTR